MIEIAIGKHGDRLSSLLCACGIKHKVSSRRDAHPVFRSQGDLRLDIIGALADPKKVAGFSVDQLFAERDELIVSAYPPQRLDEARFQFAVEQGVDGHISERVGLLQTIPVFE